MGSAEWQNWHPAFKLLEAPVAGQTGTKRSTNRPRKIKQVASQCGNANTTSTILPPKLVGTKCTAEVTIEGRKVNCLLDTGSQVTTVPLSFFQTHLSHHSLKSLDDLLDVELQIEGANGEAVPYLGYVELNLLFPEEFLGKETDVPTLVLVVPNVNSVPQVLIGTNTLDVLYSSYVEKHDCRPQSSLPGYKVVLKILEVRKKQASTGALGLIRARSNTPEVVPAGGTVVVEGQVHMNGAHQDKWAVIEAAAVSSIPGGLLVASSLCTLPVKRPCSMSILLRNETQHDVTIPPRTVLAEIHAVQHVMGKEPPADSTAPDSKRVEFDFGDSPLPPEWKERISKLLNGMPEVFSQHDMDFGHTNKVKHHINLSDNTPFKHRPRPIHPHDVDAVKKHLQELLDSGVIRESESPFASPIVVVRKKDGSVRLCIDFRKLNLHTIKDAYALPNLEEVFSLLTGSKWFSVLDLKSGYYQVEMEEADKQKTAFVCPLGFWEFNRMPQGITNAPSTFQRLMERCVGDLNRREALVFIDDLIIFSDTLEQHESRLLQVLNRLKEYGLKLSSEKCKFFQTSVKYLGHIVSQHGVETDPLKIEALKTWPVPENLKQLRSFLGFSGYYRRFVKNYSKITKPLNDLTAGYPPLRKNSHGREKTLLYFHPKEPFGKRWTPECQSAFEEIIDKLTTAPVLGFADPKLPYVLNTDASTSGLGAVLYQEQDGRMRAIAFASRGLTKSEAKYPAHKLEFLALKWAVTAKFGDYLYGTDFTVVTDSNPLTYILTSAKLDATSYRWLSALSTYNFKLQYRAGTQNQDADGLSRRPHGELRDDAASRKERERIEQFTLHYLKDQETPDVVLPDVVKAICERHDVEWSHENSTCPSVTLVESLAVHSDALPSGFQQEEDHGLPVIGPWTEEEMRAKQQADPVLRVVIEHKESGDMPSPTLRQELPDLVLWLREWRRLNLRGGVLYRARQEHGQVTHQLVLPAELRATALRGLHDDLGHLGIERTLDLVRSRFYWPRMSAYVEQKIKMCERCVRRKTPNERAAPLCNIKASRPLELVCMDFLSVEPDQSNTKDILVLTDHFTKYAVAIPTRNQKAQTVAKCLWENFLVHYGFPEKLLSDQGPDFESRTIKELCSIAGIQKVRTTPYHPRGNPVERFNRTLLQMLGTLENKDKSHWREFVKPLVHAYNCTRNDVTGFSPYELMFGRQPRLPVDLAFGLPSSREPKSHSQYVHDLKGRLEESYRVATENASKTADRNKQRFDKRVVESTLETGDRVLVRNVRIRGKHKLADKWEPDVHVVVNRAGNLPVYTVKPERKEGPLRTLHRDLLLPCGFLPVAEPEQPPKQTIIRPRTRRQLRMEAAAESEVADDNSESEENDYYYYLPGETLNTDIIETRLLTRPETVPARERHLGETNQPTLSSVGRLPAPVDLEERTETLIMEKQDREKRPAPERETVERIPSSDRSHCSGWKGTSAAVDPEAEVASRHRGTDAPKVRRALFGNSQDAPSDISRQGDETSPVPLSMLESPSEPNIMDESLPVFSDLSFSDSTKDEGCSVHKPCEDMSVDRTNERVAAGTSGRETSPVIMGESECDNVPRRSQRYRELPERLQYGQLGNPLLSIVQSLFQGLNLALADALQHPSYADTPQVIPRPTHSHVGVMGHTHL